MYIHTQVETVLYSYSSTYCVKLRKVKWPFFLDSWGTLVCSACVCLLPKPSSGRSQRGWREGQVQTGSWWWTQPRLQTHMCSWDSWQIWTSWSLYYWLAWGFSSHQYQVVSDPLIECGCRSYHIHRSKTELIQRWSEASQMQVGYREDGWCSMKHMLQSPNNSCNSWTG